MTALAEKPAAETWDALEWPMRVGAVYQRMVSGGICFLFFEVEQVARLLLDPKEVFMCEIDVTWTQPSVELTLDLVASYWCLNVQLSQCITGYLLQDQMQRVKDNYYKNIIRLVI